MKGVERRIMISFIVEDLVITLNIKVILLFIIFWLLILGLIITIIIITTYIILTFVKS